MKKWPEGALHVKQMTKIMTVVAMMIIYRRWQ